VDEDIHEALTERSSSMKTFSTRLSFTATCGMLAVVLTMIVFSAVDDPRACEDLEVLLSIARSSMAVEGALTAQHLHTTRDHIRGIIQWPLVGGSVNPAPP